MTQDATGADGAADPQSDDDLSSPVDVAVGDWLEAGTPIDEASFNRQERGQLADLLMVNSLLQHLGQRDPAAREERIRRVAEAIAEDQRPQQVATFRSRRWWAALVPAVIAAGLSLVMLWPSTPLSNTAMAAVEASLRDAEQAIDRHYAVTAHVLSPFGGERDIVSQLWVRGGTAYVWQHDAPEGTLSFGSDGKEHWIVPPVGPVVVGQSPGLLEQLILGDRLHTPYLQVTAILHRLADDYLLEMREEVEISLPDQPAPIRCSHIVGKKKDTASDQAADVIELWTERQSGVAQRVDLHWEKTTADGGLQDLRFERFSVVTPLSAHWYHHTDHHAADRTVFKRESPATAL